MNELSTLPPYDANRFYRRISELAEKYFENPENQKRFEEILYFYPRKQGYLL